MNGGCCALAHAWDDIGDASVRMTLPTPMKTLPEIVVRPETIKIF